MRWLNSCDNSICLAQHERAATEYCTYWWTHTYTHTYAVNRTIIKSILSVLMESGSGACERYVLRPDAECFLFCCRFFFFPPRLQFYYCLPLETQFFSARNEMRLLASNGFRSLKGETCARYPIPKRTMPWNLNIKKFHLMVVWVTVDCRRSWWAMATRVCTMSIFHIALHFGRTHSHQWTQIDNNLRRYKLHVKYIIGTNSVDNDFAIKKKERKPYKWNQFCYSWHNTHSNRTGRFILCPKINSIFFWTNH